MGCGASSGQAYVVTAMAGDLQETPRNDHEEHSICPYCERTVLTERLEWHFHRCSSPKAGAVTEPGPEPGSPGSGRRRSGERYERRLGGQGKVGAPLRSATKRLSPRSDLLPGELSPDPPAWILMRQHSKSLDDAKSYGQRTRAQARLKGHRA